MKIIGTSGIEKETKWRRHIERANARTGSLEKFCLAEGLSMATLNYWRKKLKDDSRTSMQAISPRRKLPQFIPIQMTESTTEQKNRNLPDAAWLAEFILQLTAKGVLR
jgi:hypothetical protein